MQVLLNHFRTKKIRDKYLVIADTGQWVGLDERSYRQLNDLKIEDEKLFRVLESKGIIITKRNEKRVVDHYKKRYNFLDYKTPLHIINTTQRCNQNCVYCHSKVKGEEINGYTLTKETAEKILEFIFNSPCDPINIEFQGGEPLLNKEVIYYVVKEAKRLNEEMKKDMCFNLMTNLIKMDKEFLEWCIHEEIGLCTSLDGPKELHDKNRPMKNGSSHEKATAMIKTAKKFYDKQIAALPVITKESLKHPKDIVDEYVKNGQMELHLKPMNKLGYAENNWDNIHYDIEEFLEFWKTAVEYMIELNKKGIHVKERYATFVLKKILTDFDPGFTDFRSPCGAAIGQITYNWDGSIYTCDEGRNFEMFKMGNVFKDNYKNVILSDKTKKIVESTMLENYICDTCVYKPFCGICIVNNMGMQGSMIPKIPTNSDHIYNKFIFDYIFEKIIFEPETREILKSWI